MTNVLHDPDSWDPIAVSYDASVRALLGPFSERALDWSGLDESDDVLDVACGPGTLTMMAAAHARTVDALDFSPGMIDVLQQNTASMANVTGHVGDGQNLPFEAERFSLAFSMFGVILFPDPAQGLREIHRVLRTDGRVVIGAWPPRESSPIMSTFGAAVARAVPPPPRPDGPPPEPLPFDSRDALEEGLRAAGFVDVEVLEMNHSVPIHSGDHFWGLMNGSPQVRQLQVASGDEWPEMEKRIVTELGQSVAGINSLGMPALLGRGVRRGR